MMDHEKFIGRNIILPGGVPSTVKAILKSSTAGYCTTCVARNRKTKQLNSTKLLDAFNLLLPGREKGLSEFTRVCWECEALLLKCLRFRSRAEQAQCILIRALSEAKSATVQSLSTLTTKIITNHIEPDRQEVDPFSVHEYTKESVCQNTDLDIKNASRDAFSNDVSVKSEEMDETKEVSIDPFEDQCLTFEIKDEPENTIEIDRAPRPIVVAGRLIPVTVIKQVERNMPPAKQKHFVPLVSNNERVPILNVKSLESNFKNNQNSFLPLTHSAVDTKLKNVFVKLTNSIPTNQSGKLNPVGGAKFIQLQTPTLQFRNLVKPLGNVPVTLFKMKTPKTQISTILTSQSSVNQTGTTLTSKSLIKQANIIVKSNISPVDQDGTLLTTKAPVIQTGTLPTSKSLVNETGTMPMSKSPVNQSRLAQLSKLLLQKKLEQKNKLQHALVKSDQVLEPNKEDVMVEEEKATIAILKEGNEAVEPCTLEQRADNGESRVQLTQQEGTDEAVYKCVECEFTGDRRNTYQHVKMKHKNLIMSDKSYWSSSLRCYECDKIFTCKTSMYLHRQRVHKLKGTGLECDVCLNKYPDSTALRTHKRRVHWGFARTLECAECHRKYRGVESLRTHMRQHEYTQPVRCDKCDIVFPSRTFYDRHVRGSAKHVGETQHRFECDTCGETFYYKAVMREHILHKHLHVRRVRPACGKCNKVLSSKRSLFLHIKNVHEKAEKPMTDVCEICGKAFPSIQHLKRHMAVHSSARPFACTICGDTFKMRVALYNHNKLKHLKEKRPQQKKNNK